MFRTLHRKLLWLFLGFGTVMVIIFIMVMRFSHETYHLEFDQTVNHDLARSYLEASPLLQGAPLSTEKMMGVLVELARINQSIDLYILDADGAILAASVAQEQLARRRIALDPVTAFLGGTAALPILGDDPRDGRGRQVFSAARISSPDSAARYLYVVLHRRQHGTSADQLKATYAINEGVGALVAAVVLAVGASLIFLRLLTRRLAVLGSAMEHFRHTDFTQLPSASPSRDDPRSDEIDHLNRLFLELASRVRGQMAELQRTDEMRREFLANVSHDLRTPLTILQAHLETLTGKEGLSAQEQRAFLGVAAMQCRRLVHLVQQLLEIAKLEALQVPIAPEPFQLAELIQDVVMKFETSAERVQVTLAAEYPTEAPLVFADIGLIERALDNLIDNAIRYSPVGGRVVVAALPTRAHMRVEVRDNGAGIAAEDRARVFDRFYRGDSSRSSESGHAGLGLSIVKGILRLHSVDIDFVTNDRGTTFFFLLPQVNTTPRAEEPDSAPSA